MNLIPWAGASLIGSLFPSGEWQFFVKTLHCKQNFFNERLQSNRVCPLLTPPATFIATINNGGNRCVTVSLVLPSFFASAFPRAERHVTASQLNSRIEQTSDHRTPLVGEVLRYRYSNYRDSIITFRRGALGLLMRWSKYLKNISPDFCFRTCASLNNWKSSMRCFEAIDKIIPAFPSTVYPAPCLRVAL